MNGNAVLELFAKFKLDSSDFDKGLGDAKGKVASFLNGFGKVAKVGAAAFAAVGAATVALGKQAVDAYANYEQLAGGIEKLYGKEGAEIVAGYAEQAFMTSGKSINEYYNSVSQITASLKRSIGDDMGEVAKVADVAMQVISDNVNTFGSDAEFVENAIMGLSRNNYTMIDNLKLGYAGTKEGMLQLINESGVLGKTLTDTSELAEVGFDKMILAIQEIQKQQGIAGTTAKEALTTIEGTAKATKSAWQNVLTAIGRGEGIDNALDGLFKAVFGVGKTAEGKDTGLINQIVPRVVEVMKGIGDLVVKSAPLISEKLPEVVNAVLPSLFEATNALFSSLMTFFIENLPTLINMGMEMVNSLLEGFLNDLPSFIDGLVTFITTVIDNIANNLPKFIEMGLQLIGALAVGFVNALPKILSSIAKLIVEAGKAFLKFDWRGLGRNIIQGVINGIKALGGQIGSVLLDMARSAWRSVKRFFGISSPSKLMENTIGKNIPLGMAKGINDEADEVDKAMENLGIDGLDGLENSLFKNNGSNNFANSVPVIQNGGQPKQLTVVLELDRQQFGKMIYKLNNEETQRVGVKFAGGIA